MFQRIRNLKLSTKVISDFEFLKFFIGYYNFLKNSFTNSLNSWSFVDPRIEARPAFNSRLGSVVLFPWEQMEIIFTSPFSQRETVSSIIRQVEHHLFILELFSSSKKVSQQ